MTVSIFGARYTPPGAHTRGRLSARLAAGRSRCETHPGGNSPRTRPRAVVIFAAVPCLDEQQLRALAAGDATELQRAHLASCATCREALTRISQLSATFDSQRTVRREQPPKGVLAEGTEVGHYVVRRRLGAGAMGAVYAAWDVRLEREVALKVLHLEGDLLAEARHLAKLSHPNVVAVHEVRSWGDRAVLVMELVQGQTLRAWFSAPQATLATRLQVLRQCADGLAAAHAAGIIHRDFKPDNVLVDAHDRPRLLDFGLALQGAGTRGIAGSPRTRSGAASCSARCIRKWRRSPAT